MFSIIISQVIHECDQLEKQVHELSEQTVELERVIGELGSLSGMEDVIARLRAKNAEMDSERTVLGQMASGLGRAVSDYTHCENRICDVAEQNIILYARQEIGINNFSDITNILNGMEIR